MVPGTSVFPLSETGVLGDFWPERRSASRPRCQRAPLSMEASSARLYRSVASLSASGGGSRARLQGRSFLARPGLAGASPASPLVATGPAGSSPAERWRKMWRRLWRRCRSEQVAAGRGGASSSELRALGRPGVPHADIQGLRLIETLPIHVWFTRWPWELPCRPERAK